MEILFIVASIYISITPPVKLGYWLGMVVLAYFGVVVLIDLEYRLIMHPVSIFGAALGLLVGFLRVGLLRSLVGGVVGFGAMWLVYLLGVLLMRLVSRRRGQPINDVALGFGDVNLSGVLGLMLGWPFIAVGLVISILIGGLISLMYILVMLVRRRYHAFAALPYGPFLVIGATVLIYFWELIAAFAGG